MRRTLAALLVPSAVGLVAPLWATHTAIGFTAGASGAAAVYPVDFVKTQRQTESGKKEFAGLSLPATLVHYIQRDGPLSVFRGLGVQVAGVAPEKAIKLTVNDAARSALRASFGSLSFAGELAAGEMVEVLGVLRVNAEKAAYEEKRASEPSERGAAIDDAISQRIGCFPRRAGARATSGRRSGGSRRRCAGATHLTPAPAHSRGCRLATNRELSLPA